MDTRALINWFNLYHFSHDLFLSPQDLPVTGRDYATGYNSTLVSILEQLKDNSLDETD